MWFRWNIQFVLVASGVWAMCSNAQNWAPQASTMNLLALIMRLFKLKWRTHHCCRNLLSTLAHKILLHFQIFKSCHMSIWKERWWHNKTSVYPWQVSLFSFEGLIPLQPQEVCVIYHPSINYCHHCTSTGIKIKEGTTMPRSTRFLWNKRRLSLRQTQTGLEIGHFMVCAVIGWVLLI